MLRILAVMCLLIAPLSVMAQEDPQRAQISAAKERAVDRLMDDISAARLAPNLTVGDFLRRAGGSNELRQVLRQSQQIGEPRWIDEQTCQVRLEAAGESVVAALVNIAASNPDESPLSAEAVARELNSWRKRSFAATGVSQPFERVRLLRPARVGPWNDIPDESRRQAVAAARADAARRALDSVRAVELAPGRTVADALAQPAIAQRMSQWFESRPTKFVSFGDELNVDLALSAPADETFDALVNSVHAAGDPIQLSNDDAALAKVRTEFVQRMASPVGRGVASRATVDLARPHIDFPAQPPEWVVRQLDAEGSAQTPGRSLQTQRAAQDQAIQNLRSKIGALPLSDGLTVAEAAKADPRINEALDRAMVRARVYKVDFDPDGRVAVRVGLEARDVWDEIAFER